MLGAALALTLSKIQSGPIRPQMFEGDLVLTNIADTMGKARSYDMSETAASTRLAYETETINGYVPIIELSNFGGEELLKLTEYRFKVGEGIRKMKSYGSRLMTAQQATNEKGRVHFFDFGMTAALPGTEGARYPLAATTLDHILESGPGGYNLYRDILLVISNENPPLTKSLLKQKLPGFAGLVLYTQRFEANKLTKEDRELSFPPARDAVTYRIRFDETGWHARTVASYSGLFPRKPSIGRN